MKFKTLVLGVSIIILTACSRPPDPATPTAVTEPVAIATPPAAAESETTGESEASATDAATAAPGSVPTSTAAETAPTAVPPAAAPTGLTQEAAYNGVSFAYDTSLATGVTVQTVPAPTTRVSAPGWTNFPTHDQFAFEDYILPAGFPTPAVIIYPTLETASRDSFAARQIEGLRDLLQMRPEGDAVPGTLPYLPLPNASQIFTAQFEYVAFAGGEGVRYVTMFGQSINPITNTGLHYTFQGLTDDGRFYVSATFPVRTDALPDEIESDIDYDVLVATYDEYIQEIVTTLNAQTAADFTPALTLLDDVAASVVVDREPEPRRRDDAGNPLLTIAFPVQDGQLILTEAVAIAGYADPTLSEPISITLQAGGNTLASTTAVVDPDTGNWEGTVTVPINVQGRGHIVAAAAGQADTVSVYLDDRHGAQSQSGTSITLSRPIANQTAVAGYPVLFEGRVENPIDNMMTIGVLADDCREWIARQSFTVDSAGPWTGVVFLPEGVVDETACATVYTGNVGDDWVEVQRALPLLAPDDERASRLVLANPMPLEFKAGAPARLFGMAVEAAEVQVSLTNNESQAVIVDGVTAVGDFGLWEIELLVPAAAPDLVGVRVVILDDPPRDPPYMLTSGATIVR